jgi:hypothetical protein
MLDPPLLRGQCVLLLVRDTPLLLMEDRAIAVLL